jgi:endonuclease/exonuclease/phosphatase family metal-dependent hydrolase
MHHMGFCWSLQRSADEAELAVMTNNIGQNNRQEFTSFLKSENPDLVLLQEAGGRSARYMAAYPEYKAVERGEFVLLSKWPVKNAGFVALTNEYQGKAAAWFEVETKTGPLIVYSVHVPTPRSELYRSRGLGLVAALVGTMQDGKSSTSRYRGQLDTAWNHRVELTRQLHGYLETETRPFIVVGDFNMTPNGYLYRLFADSLKDAFAATGRGFGFTLPGSTRNPLTAFGPWMRIDYLFAGPGLKPVYARVESDRKSQHRAVVAKFKRVETSHSRVDGGTGSRK